MVNVVGRYRCVVCGVITILNGKLLYPARHISYIVLSRTIYLICMTTEE